MITLLAHSGAQFCGAMGNLDFYGYLASLLIGLALGLIGGGGSILTVPVLVYLFRVNPITATAYSLFIVGSTSLVGAFPKFKQGLVNIPAALAFGLPSLAAVFFTRSFVVPHIPQQISFWGGTWSREMLMMVFFAALMIAAAISLIGQSNKKAAEAASDGACIRLPLIVGSGLIEGAITGLVGAGGGFLIIPALVLLNKIPIKEAIGTSLLIIATKSLVGFTGDLAHYAMDWRLLLTVTAIAIVGIFTGSQLQKLFNPEKLKGVFGWFVFGMGLFILIRELAL